VLIGLCGVAFYLSTITDSALPTFNIWFGSVIVAAVAATGLLISMLRGLRWLKLTSRAWEDHSELQATR
jgi:hypothetical protein